MSIENLYQTPTATLEPVQKTYISSPFTWQGRLSRVDYYLFVLFAVFISNSTAFIAVSFSTLISATFVIYFITAMGPIASIIWVAILSKRRFHDFNSSGRLAALVIVPGVNLLLILGLLFKQGDLSINDYGEPSRLSRGKKQALGLNLLLIVVYAFVKFNLIR